MFEPLCGAFPMPKVYYGRVNEPTFELTPSPDLIAIRTHSRQSVFSRGPVRTAAAGELSDGQLVASYPDAGVEVYRVDPKQRSVNDRKLALRAEPDIHFAGEVLVQPATGLPILYTENFYVRFIETLDSEDCEQLLRDAGLMVKSLVETAPNAYFAAAPEGTGQHVFVIAEQLIQRPEVIYCHPELIQPRESKQIFPQQWHLKAATVNGVAVNAHANVEAAHSVTKGLLAKIAVIDDGIDIDHPEFASTGKIIAPFDASLGTTDPRPKSSRENHGTACAGVACADGTLGASGVAPQAKLIPIRLRSGLGSIQEAKAFKHAVDNGADVISCSWGPEDGDWFNPNDPLHNHVEPLPASTRDAFDFAVTQGRAGKGCVILFAAGNGRESVDNDGYASAPQVIAVAACNDTSKRSVYSDFGKAVWCSFPSNDMGHAPFQQPNPLTPGIWTTDRVGTSGYNRGNLSTGDVAGNFANDFGGTSSACPGAAGVAALVISANPQLTGAEVRDILKRCCVKIDPQNGQYNPQGHSPFYGFGRLDAAAAVQLAKAKLSRLSIFNKLVNVPIPDLGQVQETIDVSETAAITNLVVTVRLKHSYTGDLVLTLIPPASVGGGPVVLQSRVGGRQRDLDRQYSVSTTPGLSRFAGKVCQGSWTIRVEDKAAQDSGTLEQIGLQLSLPPVTPRDATPAPKGAAAKTIVSKRATKKK
jgi:subtilisin family serine protease